MGECTHSTVIHSTGPIQLVRFGMGYPPPFLSFLTPHVSGCFQVLLETEWEVFQRNEGSAGEYAEALWDAGDRLPERRPTGGLRGRVPVLCLQ